MEVLSGLEDSMESREKTEISTTSVAREPILPESTSLNDDFDSDREYDTGSGDLAKLPESLLAEGILLLGEEHKSAGAEDVAPISREQSRTQAKHTTEICGGKRKANRLFLPYSSKRHKIDATWCRTGTILRLCGGAGGRLRPELDGLKYDGGEPAQGDPGPPQTLPYFYGPRPWRCREEIVSGATEIENTTLIQDTTLLNRILAPEEFTDRHKARRVQIFGPWNLDNYCVSSVTFDDESQFLDSNPALRLEKTHKKWVTEVGNRKTWLSSELGPIVFDEVLRKLLDRGECDVHLIGRQDFMNHPFRVTLTQKRSEHFRYYMSGLEDRVDETPDVHIQQLRQPGKRFWVFFMHNGIEVAGWNDDLRVTFKVRGHEQDQSKQWRVNIQVKDQFNFERVSAEISKLGVDMEDNLYYCIEEEEFRYSILGIPPARQRVFYKLENDTDVKVLRYKLQHLVASGASYLRVVVGQLPVGARVEEVDTEFDEEQKGRDNDHFWLAIFDTHTGELFDHNSLDEEGRDRVLMGNLRRNINRLSDHYGLRLPQVTRIIDAQYHIQQNGYDCGYIALNALLQFIVCRIAAPKAPATGPMSQNNPAAKLLTVPKFSEKQGGANDFRRTLSSIVHIWKRKQEGVFRGEPIEDTEVKESEFETALAEKQYYKIPTRKWDVTNDERWLETEDPFEEYCQLNYSRLAGKIERASEMALALVDHHLGHYGQMERVRYHLDHAGGVVFSFKRSPDPLSVAQGECPVQCPHLLDIVPVPMNCKVILQPYKPQPGDRTAPIDQMARFRVNNLLQRNDKVMIGHCESGFFAQANSGMHNNRTTLEFNGYPLATGIDKKPDIFRVLKLPQVGYFQVGDVFWGFVGCGLPQDTIPNDCLRIPDRIFSANPALTSCRENDLLIGRYLSLQGTGPALRAWKAIGGRVYPTDHARGVKDLLLPEGIAWKPGSDDSSDSEPEPSGDGNPPKIQKPDKKPGSSRGDSLRDIPSAIRTFPTTRVQQDADEDLDASQWDIDKSSEARQDRINRYREQAERSWKRQLERRRKVEARTPEYDSENSIDHALDKTSRGGLRPRKSPRRDPDTNAVIYEFSSSDEDDRTGETRRKKRARIAETLLGAAHPAIQRDVDVTSVVHPSHPLRFFTIMATDQMPPPDSRPVRPSGGDNGTTSSLKDKPKDTTSQPPKPSPEGDKQVKEPVKKPEKEQGVVIDLTQPVTKPVNEPVTGIVIDLLEPENEPETEPEKTPELQPEPETPRPVTPPTTKDPQTPIPPKKDPKPPKLVDKEDISEDTFKAAKAKGLVFCPACGTSFKSQKVGPAIKNHGPDTLCCVRNWNHLVKAKTAEMDERKKRFTALRKKGITKKNDIPKGNPDYSPPAKLSVVLISDDEGGEESASDSPVKEPPKKDPPTKPTTQKPPKKDSPTKPTTQKPPKKDSPKKNPFEFPDDDPRSEAVFMATRAGKNGRKICPHCGASLASQAYNAAMMNHGPGTSCNVTDWNMLAAKATQEMKDRRKELDKEKKNKNKK